MAWTDRYSASARTQYVIFERATVAVNEYGEEIKSWAVLAEEWACVVFGTGQERREAAQAFATAPATFHVLRNENTSDLRVTDRINFDGAMWNIASVVPSQRRNVGVDITAVRLLA